MGTYVLLTKVSPESMRKPGQLAKLAQQVQTAIRKHCPRVKWVSNYAVLGPYDYLDILEAPDDVTASKVATIIRSFGHASTETWSAIPWDRYKGVLGELSK